jgi:CRP/FNR family transcriptional regulator, cyclic AMP receptor protein
MQGIGTRQGFWHLLTADEQHNLSALGGVRKYPAAATLCVEGDPATHVFVLTDGWVKILSVTDDGHEMVLAVRGDGDTVGETSGETSGHRSATVRAIGDVRALIVSYERFNVYLDTHPAAGSAFRRTITQRWSDADTMLRRRAVTTGAQRFAALLLDLAARHGTGADGVVELVLPLSQEELASLAGTSRATVTRALSNWRRRGLIRTSQRHITITDVPGFLQITRQA